MFSLRPKSGLVPWSLVNPSKRRNGEKIIMTDQSAKTHTGWGK